MVRSLWTAANGMLAQQVNVDNIANNLANVSTTGYKAQKVQFKNLLYQNLQTKTTSANNETKPTEAQVGLGVRTAAVQLLFRQGSFLETQGITDFAINGNGFFAYTDDFGKTLYTRNGNFYWAMNDDGGITLTTSEGNQVMDPQGKAIEFPEGYISSKITIDQEGNFLYPDEEGIPRKTGFTIGLWQFQNPAGLNKEGNTSFTETAASGPAMNESTTAGIVKSTMVQGYLESSSVQVADEMVNLITAQRAYELNSRAITTTDTMMQQANNLRQ